MEEIDGDWTTHEGISDLFSRALTSDGASFRIHAPQADAIVTMWDSDIHDYTVRAAAYPTYRDLCKKPFMVPHAAVVDRQVRALAKQDVRPRSPSHGFHTPRPSLVVTRYFAAAVLALREAAFQQQVRAHQRERLGGEA